VLNRKYNPFEILKNFSDFDENFLQDITGIDWLEHAEMFNFKGSSKWPRVNIIELFDEIIVTADIPGLQKAGDVSVKINGNKINLEGEVASRNEQLEGVIVHKEERPKGKFSRTITLPAAVVSKGALATYHQGILELKFKKLQDSRVETLSIDFL